MTIMFFLIVYYLNLFSEFLESLIENLHSFVITLVSQKDIVILHGGLMEVPYLYLSITANRRSRTEATTGG